MGGVLRKEHAAIVEWLESRDGRAWAVDHFGRATRFHQWIELSDDGIECGDTRSHSDCGQPHCPGELRSYCPAFDDIPLSDGGEMPDGDEYGEVVAAYVGDDYQYHGSYHAVQGPKERWMQW